MQGRYGVRYLSYWLDPQRGTVFCLAEAPSVEATEKVHRESHGLVAAKMIEVDQRMVESFLGNLCEPAPGELWSATAFRVVAFTDMEDSTRLTQELGDAPGIALLRDHDRIVREGLDACIGKRSSTRGTASWPRSRLSPAVCGGGCRLFGATVQLAARLCDHAQPGAVLVAGAMRDLALGKGFRFEACGPVLLQGFPEPVLPFELVWRT